MPAVHRAPSIPGHSHRAGHRHGLARPRPRPTTETTVVELERRLTDGARLTRPRTEGAATASRRRDMITLAASWQWSQASG